MMWFLVGLIIFCITYYVHKHTYNDRMYNYETKRYEYDKEDKMPSPLWLIIILFIISMIPFLNVAFFILGIAIYLYGIYEKGLYFKPEGVIKKIFDFLNKEI